MDLFYSKDCASSQIVRMYFEEAGLRYNLCHVDATAAENLDPGVLRVNPSGQVPFVVENGKKVVVGVGPILRYFNTFEILGLPLGGTKVNQELASEWTERIIPLLEEETLKYASMPEARARQLIKFKRRVCIERMAQHPSLGQSYSALLCRYQELDGEIAAGYAGEVARKELGVLFRQVEELLEHNEEPFLAGADVSSADVALSALLAKTHHLRLDKALMAECPRVHEYWKKMGKRVSYRKVFGILSSASARASCLSSTVAVKAKLFTRRYS